MSAIRSRGRGGTMFVPNWRLEHDSGLDSYGLHIAQWVGSHAGDYREEHVTRNEIARRTGISRTKVSTVLDQLVALGIIEITEGARGRFVIVFDRDVWDERPQDATRPVTGRQTSTDRLPRSQTTGSHLSIGETQGEEQTEGVIEPFSDWDSWWQIYPHKVGKPAALRAFKVARKKAHFELIYAGLHRWVKHWNTTGTMTQYIPHPATWLNQERWNDECPTSIVHSIQPRERARAALDQLARRDDELS